MKLSELPIVQELGRDARSFSRCVKDPSILWPTSTQNAYSDETNEKILEILREDCEVKLAKAVASLAAMGVVVDLE